LCDASPIQSRPLDCPQRAVERFGEQLDVGLVEDQREVYSGAGEVLPFTYWSYQAKRRSRKSF